MKITLCARSKILKILEEGRAFRIQATGSAEMGSHVDLIPDSEVTAMDSIISSTPMVVADLQTITLLAGQTIDFDYGTDEFIIT